MALLLSPLLAQDLPENLNSFQQYFRLEFGQNPNLADRSEEVERLIFGSLAPVKPPENSEARKPDQSMQPEVPKANAPKYQSSQLEITLQLYADELQRQIIDSNREQ